MGELDEALLDFSETDLASLRSVSRLTGGLGWHQKDLLVGATKGPVVSKLLPELAVGMCMMWSSTSLWRWPWAALQRGTRTLEMNPAANTPSMKSLPFMVIRLQAVSHKLSRFFSTDILTLSLALIARLALTLSDEINERVKAEVKERLGTATAR